MRVVDTFRFSATSLQDFLDCERRFQLRYVAELAWPAPETDAPGKYEDHARLASDLHRLIHQHLLGMPVDVLSGSVSDERLERWWRAYLESGPRLDRAHVIPEVTLSIPLAGHRLSARYDAVAFSREGELPRAVIFDWKTFRRRPTRQWLGDRLQTCVYPFVLAQAGACLNDGCAVDPDQMEMYYWLAEYPEQPERFSYSLQAYDADAARLERLVTRIARRIDDAASRGARDEPWPLTLNVRLCLCCVYRSLCRRGLVAGSIEEYPGDSETEDTALPSDVDEGAVWGQVQDTVY